MLKRIGFCGIMLLRLIFGLYAKGVSSIQRMEDTPFAFYVVIEKAATSSMEIAASVFYQ